MPAELVVDTIGAGGEGVEEGVGHLTGEGNDGAGVDSLSTSGGNDSCSLTIGVLGTEDEGALGSGALSLCISDDEGALTMGTLSLCNEEAEDKGGGRTARGVTKGKLRWLSALAAAALSAAAEASS